MKQIQHLAPFHGLNPVNIAEEVGLEGTHMRGGFNVEVIDAEWWCRHGLGQLNVNLSVGTVIWRWIVSSSTSLAGRMFLVSDNYVVGVWDRFYEPGVRSDSLLGEFIVPYPEGATVTANYTTGSVSAQITAVVGTMKMGQLIRRAGFAGVPDAIYRVTSPGAGVGTNFQLDRPWEHPSGSNASKFYDALIADERPGGVLDDDTDGGCVVFEQTATFVANQLGYAHPAVAPGTYVVIHSARGYVACPLISSGAPTQVPVKGFVRETQLPVPPAVSLMPVRPGEYKDRLFMKQSDGRSCWYSRPFDFMQWHTGLQGLGGTPNSITLQDPTDPISGFAVSGDTLVIHRRSSQDILQPYGIGFRVTHNASGIGFWPMSQMIELPTGHFGWTRYGPAMFTGEGMEILFPQIERMLSGFVQAERGSPKIRGIIHDQNRRRLYCLMGWERIQAQNATDDTQRIVRHQDAAHSIPQSKEKNFDDVEWYARTPIFVVDYARNESWLEDHVGICGGGCHLGQMYFFRYDGTVVPHPTGWSGQDYDVNRTNAKHPVEAQVETQWMALGTQQRKALEKIYVLMRALDNDMGVDEILGDHFDPLRIEDLGVAEDTLHLATVEIQTDHSDVIRATADITVSVAEMRARSLEGNRMLPVMMKSITPRCAGLAFKFQFKNTLSESSAAAGYKQGSFRLVDMLLEFEVEADTRAAALTGGRP